MLETGPDLLSRGQPTTAKEARSYHLSDARGERARANRGDKFIKPSSPTHSRRYALYGSSGCVDDGKKGAQKTRHYIPAARSKPRGTFDGRHRQVSTRAVASGAVGKCFKFTIFNLPVAPGTFRA